MFIARDKSQHLLDEGEGLPQRVTNFLGARYFADNTAKAHQNTSSKAYN